MTTVNCPDGYYLGQVTSYCAECPPQHFCLNNMAKKCASNEIAAPDRASCIACGKGTYPAPDSDLCIGTTSTTNHIPSAIVLTIVFVAITLAGIGIVGFIWRKKKVHISRTTPQLKYDDLILPPSLLAPAPSPEFDYDNKDLLD